MLDPRFATVAGRQQADIQGIRVDKSGLIWYFIDKFALAARLSAGHCVDPAESALTRAQTAPALAPELR
jgi:hypothetical protein